MGYKPVTFEKTTARLIEEGMAWLIIIALVIGFALSFAPDEILESGPLVAFLVAIASLLLISWISLLMLHLKRIIVPGDDRYSLARVLLVLFIPFLGVSLATLRYPQKTRDVSRICS